MKTVITILGLLVLSIYTNRVESQPDKVDTLYQEFFVLYNKGDIVNAENKLLRILIIDDSIPDDYRTVVFNNLGSINSLLGKYETALDYYSKAEEIYNSKQEDVLFLAAIYINKAIIYGSQKSYSLAIEYFEKGIRIYLNQSDRDDWYYTSLSSAYMNYGVTLLETKKYKSALTNFLKSAEIKSKYNLPGLGLAYLNIAKTYVKTNDPVKAEEFYLKSISFFKNEFHDTYFRLSEVYLEYGLFLQSAKRIDEALEANKKALLISVENFGEKHILVSYACKLIGDDYMLMPDINSALQYYQKSLIAISPGFNNTDIYSNPSLDSSLFNIRLLDNLKSKAQALELLAGEQNDPDLRIKTIKKCHETIGLAIQLIDIIRNNYISEESRMYLAEHEKETYIYAIHIASDLCTDYSDKSMDFKMYEIARKAKAVILRNEITGNELLYSSNISDTLREKQYNLSSGIAAYNNLILEEYRKINPDSSKTALWKDALFEMNRGKEDVADEINSQFPQYSELKKKTDTVSLDYIMQKLKKDETIVDYLLSNQYTNGKRNLYVFVINNKKLDFREISLDSLFFKNALILKNISNPSLGFQENYFSNYTAALNYMYLNLIKPVEEYFNGKKLIIIPDEEIGWLPFDAFIKNKPEGRVTDWESLNYLIKEYTISYAYSSSLIFNKSSILKRGARVLAFSPDYSNTSSSGMEIDTLQGASIEIKSIFKWFNGKSFTGMAASKKAFLKASENPAIFHLAMHSMADTTNSLYSYMLFDSHDSSAENNKLYDYEISISRIKSPMVVLSACNSGTGTLHYGEGMMSLARGFILAGASSVVKTSWNVNDEVSADIIGKFYFNLSKGKPKNEAMRSAKLEYIKNASPEYINPWYWAAYEVLGDNKPIVRRNTFYIILTLSIVVIIAAGSLFIYFRYRRIFSDRSL